jgi:hypothetical protein
MEDVMAMRVVFVTLVVAALALAGCQGTEATPAAGTVGDTASSAIGRPGGLDRVSALALGTLRLEGTEEAVTAAQASDLLPLWQMIQSGSLQGDAETDAVVVQIEASMTEAQRAAIAAMALTVDDLQAWMEKQGIESPEPGSGQGGQGGPGALQNLSEEERAQMREAFQNMTPEERATRMAELGQERPESEGTDPGARPSGGSRGLVGLLLDPLVELLAGRAAE